MSGGERLSFPRQQARTRRFTLGVPRAFRIAADGSRVLFLRSPAGDDPVTQLWSFDLASGRERLVCDPAALGGDGEVPPEERARRERVRETAEGIVAFRCDRDATVAAFALGRRAYLVTVETGDVLPLVAASPALDPAPDPTGRRVAYVSGGSVHVVDRGGRDRSLAADDDPSVTWGLAAFVEAEEIHRTRGLWWSPEGEALIAERVDVSPVAVWHIANPTHPEQPPSAVRYPAAGAANADVGLAVLSMDGGRVEVAWDKKAFPYLVDVVWSEGHDPLVVAQTRDQRTIRILEANPATGETRTIHEDRGEPWLDDGRLATVTEDAEADTRRLVVGEEAMTPPGLQVASVVSANQAVVFVATEEPTESHVWRWTPDGGLARLTTEPGVHAAAARGDVSVIASAAMDRSDVTTTVWRLSERVGEIASFAHSPVLEPNVSLRRLGPSELRSAILLPGDGTPGATVLRRDGRLPVLLDPYGGPQAQRVVAARGAFLASQWLADQGFAVLVADGRGTPARGLAWERAVHRDLASPALEDQVEALHAAAALDDRLDLTRVAIRGWSFGGYLAALAVLRRPDVFHAAVAGAPVTDWHLYDTHYTERFLGLPQDDPDAYRQSSIIEEAAALTRPLLLVHGLADDNVVVAHTLRFSQALMEAGRPHAVLPLSGVTHMTSQEVVAENLLLLQVAFLRDALAIALPG
jgi:dipeptidyl-peptidase-4